MIYTFRALTLFAGLLSITSGVSWAQDKCPTGTLLTKKQLKNHTGVKSLARVHDGIMPAEGSAWNGVYSAVLTGPDAHITYDLGAQTTINGLVFQGDNNDTYVVSTSDNGTDFKPIWTVPAHPHSGMRQRLTQGLNVSARYLRLSQPKGDGSFSVGEFQAYCTLPAIWPPSMDIRGSVAKKDSKRARRVRMASKKMTVASIGFICFIALLCLRRRAKFTWTDDDGETQDSTKWPEWLTAISALALAGFMLWAVWQEFKRLNVGAVRIALGVAVLSLAWFVWCTYGLIKDRVSHTWLTRGALLIIVFSGGMSWINYGTFHGSRAVHYWDTFHYYIGGKYFQENEYHLLYHCSAIAEVDDGRAKEFSGRKIRDLRNNALGPAKLALESPDECRERFTPERWAAFRQDLRLFRSYMGKDWWEKMFKDHGFNATPVWTLAGSTLTNIGWRDIPPPAELENSPANLKGASAEKKRQVAKRFAEDRAAFKSRIEWLNLTDGLLYVGAFALIWWAFGLWGCAFAILIWGVGYPWAFFWTGGGFGRVPWFFMAVAGTCFFKKGYSMLGGGAITWSMLLRVFPGALIAGVSLKMAHSILTKRTLSKSHLRIIIGCVLALAVLVPLSLPVVNGFSAYSDFIGNSFKHKSTPLTNHMGLPTLLAYSPSTVGRKTRDNKLDDPFLVWKQERQKLQDQRKWAQSALILLFLGLIWYAGRRLDDWEVTALSTILMTSIFELTCYYYSYFVLLALLSLRRPIYMISMIGLVIGGHVIQLNVGWYDEQYTAESALALGVQLFILLGLVFEVYRADRRGDPLPSDDAEAESDASQPADLEEAPAQATA